MKNITIIDVWGLAVVYFLVVTLGEFIGMQDANETIATIKSVIPFCIALTVYSCISRKCD